MSEDNIWLFTSVRMFVIAIVLIGGVNWFAVAFGYNLVESLNRILSRVFHKRLPLDTVIYFIVGLCSIALAFDRTLWLPFLGESVLPSALVSVTSAKASTNKVDVHVRPNVKVAYWSANPGNNPDTPVEEAYGKFENSGVVMSDDKGVATLSFEKGTEYVVPSGKRLKSHVHYRELAGKYGMMGPVQSVFV
jgi:uncharacterized membrane protein YuzA (DUF378 family)